eukprot:TRINITY_DN1151_c0_g1_i21.p2 TRINITY_DN1151_c0_g1~~TRINITY_DN1151_c0_g1_i21.p2  ORF type:complete len:150 (+),score=37.56 TRINITY_DN1151_c0_g1_i21:49-498(+)
MYLFLSFEIFLFDFFFFFFFKQKTAYEMLRSLVGSEMCIRDRYQRRVRGHRQGEHVADAVPGSVRRPVYRCRGQADNVLPFSSVPGRRRPLCHGTSGGRRQSAAEHCILRMGGAATGISSSTSLLLTIRAAGGRCWTLIGCGSERDAPV